MDPGQDWQESATRSASQLNSAWNTEASLVHWSSPGLKMIGEHHKWECVCVCVWALWETNSNVSCTASVQLPGRLSSPPELWSETSLSIEQCGTKLRLAGKWPPMLYHRCNKGLAAKSCCLRNTASEVLRRLLADGDKLIGVCFSLCYCLLATLVCSP